MCCFGFHYLLGGPVVDVDTLKKNPEIIIFWYFKCKTNTKSYIFVRKVTCTQDTKNTPKI